MIHESPDDFSSIAAPVAIFNYQTLLEHVIGCSDHPSVHHYGSGVHGETEIVYASLGCEKSTEVALEFHQLTLDFVRQNVDLARNSYCDENVSMILEALTKELFTHPSASVAASLCHMCVATDQNDFDIAPIVEPWTISEALLLLLPYHRLFPRRWGRRSRVWSEGSRARTKPWIMRLADVARRCAEIRSKVCRTCLR